MSASVSDFSFLKGVKVVDFTQFEAGPSSTEALAWLGAEVVKIEQPGRGDFMRDIGPFADTEGGRYSLFWAVEGRGRKSVTIDLRMPRGQDLVRRLAAQADVLCENFRPGTLESWGLGPTDLDPRLVVVRISAFGQDGPYAQRPGLDRTGIGYGGLLHLTGYPDRPPVRPGLTTSDYLTGVFAAQAALAALYRRDAGPNATGRGAVIDAALYGSVLRILEWTIAGYDRLGVVREREGNRLANSAPLDNYPTGDGRHVCLVAGSDANFARLCAAMDRPELPTDPRFATLADRAKHADEINAIVAEWTAGRPAADVEAAAVAHGVPVARAYTAADIAADAHMAARSDLVAVDDPVLGALRQQAPFPRFVGESSPTPSGAPRLGEHTREVLGEALGLSATELDDLAADAVI